jgi:hypothetical protein
VTAAADRTPMRRQRIDLTMVTSDRRLGLLSAGPGY